MPDQYSLEDRPDRVALAALWDQALDSLGRQLSSTSMDKFVRTLTPDSLDNGVAVLVAPGQFVYEWVKDKFQEVIEEELSRAADKPVRVEVRMKVHERTRAVAPPVTVSETPASNGIALESTAFVPSHRQRFESFVVGTSNRLAFAGATAVADSPGGRFNPLFIYSQSGLGKTHLLHAIANRLLATQPRLGVAYMTGQMFTEEYVSAVQNNRVDQFRRKVRSAQVWLLDDVQLLMGRDKTQEELFHAFNHLHSLGRQIVVCSDRPPRDLLNTHERLRSRMEMGLVIDIQMPDTETRAAILLKRAEQEGFLMEPGVAMAAAEQVSGSVRNLEGALNRIMALQSVDRTPLTPEYVREICAAYCRDAGPSRPGFSHILKAVAEHHKVSEQEIMGTSRKANIAHARHVAVFITREILADSWKHIGALFGNKDHTTMMHGYRKIREMMDRDRQLSSSIKGLMRDLYPES